MNIDTISLPPTILQYNSTSNRQIVFKIHNKYREDFYTNQIITKLKNVHLSSSIKYTINTNDGKIIGEHDFKNIN